MQHWSLSCEDTSTVAIATYIHTFSYPLLHIPTYVHTYITNKLYVLSSQTRCVSLLLQPGRSDLRVLLRGQVCPSVELPRGIPRAHVSGAHLPRNCTQLLAHRQVVPSSIMIASIDVYCPVRGVAKQSAIHTYIHTPNRYLISGSDYGERKLLLWDAKLDSLMTDPKQFPHIIFWSSTSHFYVCFILSVCMWGNRYRFRSQEGLIKKIIIRQGPAHQSFWLAKGQHDLLTESSLELWEGEMEPG